MQYNNGEGTEGTSNMCEVLGKNNRKNGEMGTKCIKKVGRIFNFLKTSE